MRSFKGNIMDRITEFKDIKKSISSLNKLFDKELGNVSTYRFAKLSGCSKALLLLYKNGDRKISIEKKVNALENFYKNNK